MPPFPLIAIVGQGCVLPGAASPDALWRAVLERRDLLSTAPAGRWGVDRDLILGAAHAPEDRTWSDRGGYVLDFEKIFDPEGFALPAREVRALDPLAQWLLHAGRAALGGCARPAAHRAGAVVGNLSFPSHAMSRFAERVWLGDALADAAGVPRVDARARLMSGLPAHLLVKGLGFSGPGFALDAACASSLYAIKLACDRLHDGDVDLMLAGAVSCADDLFIHVGFCALRAMSRSGQSRPFHADADGLVPAEGVGLLALKRLADAHRDGDPILGVIRGVGLSNDGRGRGLLVPSAEGQVRAMRAAYAAAGLHPRDISLVECHATGTVVGDRTEIESMTAALDGAARLPIGSLKSNLGHLITAAGAAGVIKVLAAMKARTLPPSRHDGPLNAALEGSPFSLLQAPAPWEADGPLRAAVSAFGFGGNNAHLLLEEPPKATDYAGPAPAPAPPAPLAIVGLGVMAGPHANRAQLAAALDAAPRLQPRGGDFDFETDGLRIPPNDLAQTLPQQLWVLQAAREAVAGVTLPAARTAALVGMGTDPEVARYGARWRLAQWAPRWGADATWLEEARARFVAPLESAGVLGTMPNIPTNRLNQWLDLGGPSLSVCAEELSGLRALEIAARGLRRGEFDAAVVGAVDLSCEPVHEAAMAALGQPAPAGDAAVVLVLKRLDDARRAGDPVLALLEPEVAAGAHPALAPGELSARVGVAHAAWGLLQVACGALCLARGRAPGGQPLREDRLLIQAQALGDQHTQLLLRAVEGADAALASAASATRGKTMLRFPSHAPAPSLPALPASPQQEAQLIPRAPRLEPVLQQPAHEAPTPTATQQTTSLSAPDAAPQTTGLSAPEGFFARLQAQHALMGAAHMAFVEGQGDAHLAFLDFQQRAAQHLLGLSAAWLPEDPSPHHAPPVLEQPPAPLAATPRPPAPSPGAPTPPPAQPAPPAPRAAAKAPTPTATAQTTGLRKEDRPGPRLDRDGLKVHASGKISEIFGAAFAQQDGYEVQVRMPEPPLLLADRVVGIAAEPGSMKTGTIWTETDVDAGAWYLHDGRMPAGLMIESGQADLMLISYLGIDWLLRGERRYRLLGCELTYHGSLPSVGETLEYEIHVDGHARQGDIRLFFFHYDCVVAGQPRLSVRHGQAGFFNREELDASMGVLWTPEEGERTQTPRLDEPRVVSQRRSFGRAALEDFAAGRVAACFGPGFELTACHTRSPKIAGGRMLFLEEVTHFEPGGGPWGRGYLRAVDHIQPDDWFFDGHFKNDPCMPGTLMFEGCLQAMAFYMAGLGMTLDRDGWRFEPVPGEPYKMICRGEVGRASKLLVYEVFVEEVIEGDEPRLYADLLCTVDGLKAFHCRRMGLRMVPDWPLEAQRPTLALEHAHPGEVAVVDGFRFDYASLLACAWGRPSSAFGPMYAPFDGVRRVARLPGPPYHFMSRVSAVKGPIGGMEAGTTVEIEYDIPHDAWYFADNGCATMPYCVLLEAALQPCGWLASYVGSAAREPRDVRFRNLDGTGTLLAELLPGGGPLRTKVTITNISRSAGMIIESFEVQCVQDGRVVFTMNTVFGFFPPEALANQIGLAVTEPLRAWLEAPSQEPTVDLTAEPARYFAGTARLCEPYLRVIDRVTGIWADGGAAGLGRYRSEQDIRPDAWYFRAHFYQDPVQPGSLGLEAMIQLLQFAMLHKGMAEGMDSPRFEPIMLERPLTWKYRGQVVPWKRKVNVTLELTEQGEDARGRYAIASASLWVDGLRIYEASNLGMRLVSGRLPRPGEVERLDPAAQPWWGDHRPTWTVPALPMMSMVERLAAAASREDCAVVGLRDVRVKRWLPLPAPLSWRRAGTGDEVAVELYNEDGPVATGTALLGRGWVAGPAPLPPLDAPLEDSPYKTGALFHGPSFQRLRSLRVGASGASAWLDAARGDEPEGVLNEILLDAATHAIPHDALHRWCAQIPADQVAYPAWITRLSVHGPTPRAGLVRCEVRFDGFAGGPRFPAFQIQLIVGERVWAAWRLVEALFPKGPLGCAPPLERRAFLRDRAWTPSAWLSTREGAATWLDSAEVEGSDWLPGTVAALYGTRDVEEIAAREHIARDAHIHPGALPGALPLTRHTLKARWEDGSVEVVDAAPEALDLSQVRAFWGRWFAQEGWPTEDLYYGLIERFVRRVVVPDPAALAAVKGRGCLLLGNHQVGVESLLFSIVASALLERPVVTLAKAEHHESWLGNLIELCFSYPGIDDPGVIAFFEREDKSSLPLLLAQLGQRMATDRSLMIHIEGTRALQAGQAVEKMSGALLDMALAQGAPVIPVRFVGGLPRDPLAERLEFPVALGRQDYWIGRPILPEELSRLTYLERKRLVLDAINALGPPLDQEAPIPGLPGMEKAARAWQTRYDVDHTRAVLGATLAQVEAPCDQTRRLLTGQRGPDSAQERWLWRLRAFLTGEAP